MGAEAVAKGCTIFACLLMTFICLFVAYVDPVAPKWILVPIALVFPAFIIMHFMHKAFNGYIRKYNFPDEAKARLKTRFPLYAAEDINDVFEALKDYFMMQGLFGKRMLPLPSKAVEVAWIEFAQSKRDYAIFCIKAFPFRSVSCQPSVGFSKHWKPCFDSSDEWESTYKENATWTDYYLQFVWTKCCEMRAINPINPHVIPLLFSLDRRLDIDGGIYYSLEKEPQDGSMSVFKIGQHIPLGEGGRE